ncbi:hypothetical protein FQR65_LT05155 [Abscondita terminalis]|nr:hypothetical protein FQR65_LT05155 [Abscondita terminalis]
MKSKILRPKFIQRAIACLGQLSLWMSAYFYTSLALADDDNLGAYMAGIGFCMASMLKFKAHKDNPTQIPIGTPIALLFIGAALIFLPNIFRIAGYTVFGGTSGAGGVYGTTGLPGEGQ